MDNIKELRYNVVVVGTGGTGTYFLKEFSRMIAGGHRSIVSLNCIDGDTVEVKNLARQAFTKEDVGRNKAVVMAEVLSSAFNLTWHSHSEYLSELSEVIDIAGKGCKVERYYNTVPLIIGCGDNHALRLLLEEYFNSVETCFYLDSANEFSAGEVVFSYKLNGKVFSPLRSKWFPDILKGDLTKRTDMSCEELNSVTPQHIATNMQAGNILLHEVSCLLDGNLHPGMVTFDTDSYYQEFTPYEAA